MSSNRHPIRFRVSLFVFIGVAIGLIYGRLIRGDPVLARDDRRLVASLASIGSLREYVGAVAAGRILDVQPVRDLFLKGDLVLRDRTGIATFHLTNTLLWLAILAVVHRILLQTLSSRPLPAALLILFAVHPIFVGSVGWISARKHLLSCLFILLATLLVLRAGSRLSAKRTAAIGALYTLSVFSQPITLLWPLWAVFQLQRESPRNAIAEPRLNDSWRLAVACVIPFAACATLNYLYYTGPYLEQTGAEKFVGASHTAGVALLAQGRYFANLVLPVRLATAYDPGSPLNLAGLLLEPLGIGWLLKVLRMRAVSWLLFYLLPLLVVTVKMTNIFVSDTYLLVPAVGFLCIVGLLLEGASQKHPRITVGVLLLAAVAGAFGSLRQARSWESDAALWANAYQVEPTPNASAKHAYFLIEEGKAAEAVGVALRLGDWDPSHPEYPYLLSRAIYSDSSRSIEEKLQLMESYSSRDPWFEYYFAALLAKASRPSEALIQLRDALAHPSAFKKELPIVAAEAVTLCKRSGERDCAEMVAMLRGAGEWNESLFQRRMQGFARSETGQP